MRSRDEYFTRSFRLDIATNSVQDKILLSWLRAAARQVAHYANACATLEFVRRQLETKADGKLLAVRAEQARIRRDCGAYVSSYVTDAVAQAAMATFAGEHGKQLWRAERSLATFTAASALRIRLDKLTTNPLRLEGSDVILRIRLFAPGPVDIRCAPGSLVKQGEVGIDGYALTLRRLLSGEYPIRTAQFLLGGLKPALRIQYQLPGLPHEEGGTAVLSERMVLAFGERHTSFRWDCEELARRLHVLTIRRIRIAKGRRRRRVSGRTSRAMPSVSERSLVAKGEGMRRTVTQQMAAAIVRAARPATTLLLPSVEQVRSALLHLDVPWAQLFAAIESHAALRGITCSQTAPEDKQRAILRVRRLQTQSRRQRNQTFGEPVQAAV